MCYAISNDKKQTHTHTPHVKENEQETGKKRAHRTHTHTETRPRNWVTNQLNQLINEEGKNMKNKKLSRKNGNQMSLVIY